MSSNEPPASTVAAEPQGAPVAVPASQPQPSPQSPPQNSPAPAPAPAPSPQPAPAPAPAPAPPSQAPVANASSSERPPGTAVAQNSITPSTTNTQGSQSSSSQRTITTSAPLAAANPTGHTTISADPSGSTNLGGVFQTSTAIGAPTTISGSDTSKAASGHHISAGLTVGLVIISLLIATAFGICIYWYFRRRGRGNSWRESREIEPFPTTADDPFQDPLETTYGDDHGLPMQRPPADMRQYNQGNLMDQRSSGNTDTQEYMNMGVAIGGEQDNAYSRANPRRSTSPSIYPDERNSFYEHAGWTIPPPLPTHAQPQQPYANYMEQPSGNYAPYGQRTRSPPIPPKSPARYDYYQNQNYR